MPDGRTSYNCCSRFYPSTGRLYTIRPYSNAICDLYRMNRRSLLHLTFWIVYFAWVVYVEFAWATASFKDLSGLGRFWIAAKVELSLFPAKMLLCYFVLYGPLKQSLLHQKPPVTSAIRLVLGMIGAIALYRISVKWLVYPWAYGQSPDEVVLWEGYRLVTSFLDLALVLGLAIAFKLYRMQMAGKERERRLVQEKLETELQFLRSQTNPHFLFNTLNNIYALTRRQPGPAAEMVLQLSGLMRFMLYDCAKPRIPVRDEIRVIEGIIELEKLRYGDRLEVHFISDIDRPDELIAPLLLLPLIENAFKHGAGENRFKTRIDINLELKDGVLEMRTQNDKEQVEADGEAKGVGLQNVRRQLELLYPQAHDLRIDNQPEVFTAHLRVNLKAYETLALSDH